MNERQLPRRDYQALKAAFRDLVAAAGGPVRAAERTRGNASLISRYGAQHEEMFAPDDVIADLEADVGEPIVTRVRAELAGFLLVPKCDAPGNHDFLQHLGAVGQEAGEMLAALSGAMGDGRLSPGEAEDCRRAAQGLQEKLACLEEALTQVAAAGRTVPAMPGAARPLVPRREG